jgi:simple sugar transport system permease protein
MSELAPFLEAAVRTATPLLIASIGEMVSERAGVINIGLEGCIIAGAYAAFAASGAAGATPTAGYAAAILAGLSVGALLAVFAVFLRRDQIIVGTALTMLALGVTGTLFRARGDASALVVATEPVARIPFLSDIPVIGQALFAQPAITYFALVLVPAVWWWLHRTHVGLSLRAVGDAPAAARTAGVRVSLVQTCAVLFASLVFGAAMALQFVVQALGWRVRYELVLMIPYVLTLAALGAFGRGSAPAMLGRTAPAE